MTPIATKHPSNQSETSSVCQIRTDLLDRLAGTVEKLGRAKLSLAQRLQKEHFHAPHFLTNEVEQLRSDCGIIRAELEYHRSAHGC